MHSRNASAIIFAKRCKLPTAGVLGQLGRVQRMAAILISGALHSAPTDMLNYLCDLPPFPLLACKLVFRAFMCLATLPKTHPLYTVASGLQDIRIKKHCTPIQHMQHYFKADTENIEKVPAQQQDPKAMKLVQVRIDETKE